MTKSNISDLQLLTAEEMELIGGGDPQCGRTGCSPSFTCERTTCTGTVCDDTRETSHPEIT